jgi:hypothetical protein
MKKIILLSASAFLVMLFACKKNQLGGSSTVFGVVAHHEKPIPNAVVYVKFNAKEFPGSDSTKYDAIVAADANGSYSFKCYRGNYYLYATGVDNSGTPEYVSGGVPVRVRSNETFEADVAVTEPR